MSSTAFYTNSQFTSAPLGPNPLQLDIEVKALALSTFPLPCRAVGGVGIRFDWIGFATPADIALIDGAVAAHTGLQTTSAPQQFQQLGNVDTVSVANQSPFVDVLNVQSSPAVGGSYLSLATTELCMPAVVANTAIRAEYALQVDAGPVVVITGHTVPSTLAAQSGAFTPHAVLALTEGQRLRMILRISKLGASAAIARATNSRISFCKVA